MKEEITLSKWTLESSLKTREDAIAYFETVIEEGDLVMIEDAEKIIEKRLDMENLTKLKKAELQFIVDASFDSSYANSVYEDKNNPNRDLLVYTMDSGAVKFAIAKLKLFKLK